MYLCSDWLASGQLQGWDVPAGWRRVGQERQGGGVSRAGLWTLPLPCAALAAVVVQRNVQRQVSSLDLAASEPIGMDFRGIFTGGFRPSASGRRANGSSVRKSAKFRR